MLNPRSQGCSPVGFFIPRSFRVLGFTLRSMLYFELILYNGLRYRSKWIFSPYRIPVVPPPSVKKIILFPLNCTFVEN